MNSLFKIITDNSPKADIKVLNQKILIEDMTLMTSIGIYDFEKKKKQRVVVNVDLDIETDNGPQSDNIKEVISYADIVKKIEALSGSKHYNLTETFAYEIAEACLNSGLQAQKVTVKIQKPDVIENTNVGTTVTAQRA